MDKVVNTVRAVIGLTLLILVLIFCFQNMEPTEVQFLSFRAEGLPLFIALFGVFALGAFIGYLFGLISSSKKKTAKRKEQEKKTIAEAQVTPTYPSNPDEDATKPSM